MIGGTRVAKALRRRNAEGVHVAGTSAGAAFLCEHMIAFGKEGASPAGQDRDARAGARPHQPDHHRPALPPARPAGPPAHGAGLQSRSPSGSGSTRTPRRSSGRTRRSRWSAAARSRSWTPSELEFSSMARVRKNDPVCLIGLRLHILDHGATFNLHTRVAAAAPAIAQRRLKHGPPSPLSPCRDRPMQCPKRPGNIAMRILERAVYVGPSLYAHFPVIRLDVDLGELEEWPSGRLGPAFTDRLHRRAARAARARLLLRRAGRLRPPADARTRAPGWATSSSTSPSSCRTWPASR